MHAPAKVSFILFNIMCSQISELEDELERRTLTYTSWNQSNTGKGKQNWHPSTFQYETASPQHIKKIKVNYNQCRCLIART